VEAATQRLSSPRDLLAARMSQALDTVDHHSASESGGTFRLSPSGLLPIRSECSADAWTVLPACVERWAAQDDAFRAAAALIDQLRHDVAASDDGELIDSAPCSVRWSLAVLYLTTGQLQRAMHVVRLASDCSLGLASDSLKAWAAVTCGESRVSSGQALCPLPLPEESVLQWLSCPLDEVIASVEGEETSPWSEGVVTSLLAHCDADFVVNATRSASAVARTCAMQEHQAPACPASAFVAPLRRRASALLEAADEGDEDAIRCGFLAALTGARAAAETTAQISSPSCVAPARIRQLAQVQWLSAVDMAVATASRLVGQNATTDALGLLLLSSLTNGFEAFPSELQHMLPRAFHLFLQAYPRVSARTAHSLAAQVVASATSTRPTAEPPSVISRCLSAIGRLGGSPLWSVASEWAASLDRASAGVVPFETARFASYLRLASRSGVVELRQEALARSALLAYQDTLQTSGDLARALAVNTSSWLRGLSVLDTTKLDDSSLLRISVFRSLEQRWSAVVQLLEDATELFKVGGVTPSALIHTHGCASAARVIVAQAARLLATLGSVQACRLSSSSPPERADPSVGVGFARWNDSTTPSQLSPPTALLPFVQPALCAHRTTDLSAWRASHGLATELGHSLRIECGSTHHDLTQPVMSLYRFGVHAAAGDWCSIHSSITGTPCLTGLFRDPPSAPQHEPHLAAACSAPSDDPSVILQLLAHGCVPTDQWSRSLLLSPLEALKGPTTPVGTSNVWSKPQGITNVTSRLVAAFHRVHQYLFERDQKRTSMPATNATMATLVLKHLPARDVEAAWDLIRQQTVQLVQRQRQTEAPVELRAPLPVEWEPSLLNPSHHRQWLHRVRQLRERDVATQYLEAVLHWSLFNDTTILIPQFEASLALWHSMERRGRNLSSMDTLVRDPWAPHAVQHWTSELSAVFSLLPVSHIPPSVVEKPIAEWRVACAPPEHGGSVHSSNSSAWNLTVSVRSAPTVSLQHSQWRVVLLNRLALAYLAAGRQELAASTWRRALGGLPPSDVRCSLKWAKSCQDGSCSIHVSRYGTTLLADCPVVAEHHGFSNALLADFARASAAWEGVWEPTLLFDAVVNATAARVISPGLAENLTSSVVDALVCSSEKEPLLLRVEITADLTPSVLFTELIQRTELLASRASQVLEAIGDLSLSPEHHTRRHEAEALVARLPRANQAVGWLSVASFSSAPSDAHARMHALARAAVAPSSSALTPLVSKLALAGASLARGRPTAAMKLLDSVTLSLEDFPAACRTPIESAFWLVLVRALGSATPSSNGSPAPLPPRLRALLTDSWLQAVSKATLIQSVGQESAAVAATVLMNIAPLQSASFEAAAELLLRGRGAGLRWSWWRDAQDQESLGMALAPPTPGSIVAAGVFQASEPPEGIRRIAASSNAQLALSGPSLVNVRGSGAPMDAGLWELAKRFLAWGILAHEAQGGEPSTLAQAVQSSQQQALSALLDGEPSGMRQALGFCVAGWGRGAAGIGSLAAEALGDPVRGRATLMRLFKGVAESRLWRHVVLPSIESEMQRRPWSDVLVDMYSLLASSELSDQHGSSGRTPAKWHPSEMPTDPGVAPPVDVVGAERMGLFRAELPPTALLPRREGAPLRGPRLLMRLVWVSLMRRDFATAQATIQRFEEADASALPPWVAASLQVAKHASQSRPLETSDDVDDACARLLASFDIPVEHDRDKWRIPRDQASRQHESVPVQEVRELLTQIAATLHRLGFSSSTKMLLAGRAQLDAMTRSRRIAPP
jgi:hypothetical protein